MRGLCPECDSWDYSWDKCETCKRLQPIYAQTHTVYTPREAEPEDVDYDEWKPEGTSVV